MNFEILTIYLRWTSLTLTSLSSPFSSIQPHVLLSFLQQPTLFLLVETLFYFFIKEKQTNKKTQTIINTRSYSMDLFLSQKIPETLRENRAGGEVSCFEQGICGGGE